MWRLERFELYLMEQSPRLISPISSYLKGSRRTIRLFFLQIHLSVGVPEFGKCCRTLTRLTSLPRLQCRTTSTPSFTGRFSEIPLVLVSPHWRPRNKKLSRKKIFIVNLTGWITTLVRQHVGWWSSWSRMLRRVHRQFLNLNARTHRLG